MTDMAEYARFVVAIGIVGVVAWFLSEVLRESRRWRRLMQLYFEKQVAAPLPVDEDPDAPAESALHLPADELDELEREDEELDALRRARLT